VRGKGADQSGSAWLLLGGERIRVGAGAHRVHPVVIGRQAGLNKPAREQAGRALTGVAAHEED